MFDYISGKIAAVTDSRIVVDCGGVGFSIIATYAACSKFAKSESAKIPVYMAVREDAIELYGFSDERERALFLQLITVSGVGAKLAVAVLGGMECGRLIAVIAAGDIAALSSVKGVGKKTAERIVLELKNKVGTSDTELAPPVSENGQAAVNALIGLGYDKREAEAAVKKIQKQDMSVEQIIRAVLSSN